MVTARFESQAHTDGETDQVLGWRFDQLRRAGYSLLAATRLAWQREIDLHLAVRVLSAGCSEKTALRILL